MDLYLAMSLLEMLAGTNYCDSHWKWYPLCTPYTHCFRKKLLY